MPTANEMFKGVIKLDVRDSKPDNKVVAQSAMKAQVGKFTLARDGLCIR
jgi:hypothetical protein